MSSNVEARQRSFSAVRNGVDSFTELDSQVRVVPDCRRVFFRRLSSASKGESLDIDVFVPYELSPSASDNITDVFDYECIYEVVKGVADGFGLSIEVEIARRLFAWRQVKAVTVRVTSQVDSQN